VNIYKPVRGDGTVSIDVRLLGETEPAPQEEEEDWAAMSTSHTMHFSAYAPPRPPAKRRDDTR
jgi:hypothetical protein